MEENSLHNLLQSIGLQGLIRRNANWMALCPFHNESAPSWGISIHEPHFHGCFACGAKGTLYDLLKRVGNYTEEQLKQYKLRETEGKQFASFERQEEDYELDPRTLYAMQLTQPAFVYLRSRGIPDWAAITAGCLYDPFQERVVFPWFLDKKLMGLTGRATNPNNKVKTLPYMETRKKECLYLPKGKLPKGPLILTEGEVDALKIFSARMPNVGALGFGRFSRKQATLVLNSDVTELWTFFDDDHTGELLFKQVMERIDGRLPVYRVGYGRFRQFYKEKLDPGILSRPALRWCVHHQLERSAALASF